MEKIRKTSSEFKNYHDLDTNLRSPHLVEFIKTLQEIKSKVRSIFPQPLTSENFAYMAPTDPRLFANRRQAIFSDHNIPHLTIVAALSALDIAHTHPENLDLLRMQKRAWISGMLHDVRRRTDLIGSIFLPIHGITASILAPRLMKRMKVDEEIQQSKEDVRRIKRAIRKHDTSKNGLKSKGNEELSSLIVVDRASIARLFKSKKWLVRLGAEHLAEKRMRKYSDHAKIDRDYYNKLVEIASAADILTRNKLEELRRKGTKITPKLAYETTLETLESFGIMQSEQEVQKAA